MFSPSSFSAKVSPSCSILSFIARYSAHFCASSASDSDHERGWAPCSLLNLLCSVTQSRSNKSYALPERKICNLFAVVGNKNWVSIARGQLGKLIMREQLAGPRGCSSHTDEYDCK